ncbi:beta-1,3-glucanase family protein [Streptomyces mirabilis]
MDGRIAELGSPLYIPVSPDDQGWGGPDLRNPNDPNTDVYYDWYEYTYVFGQVAFGGNTTQVDQFGFPMTSRLTQTSRGYDTTRGITLTRAQVMSQYAASVGAAFKPLQNTYRIIAPRSSDLFLAGGSQANHLQSTIDQTWSCHSTHPFRLTRLGETFTGGVSGTTLTFTKNGAGPYTLQKPSSPDVVACAGALASGSDPEKQLGAEFCAAFNRGVALDTSAWYTPSAYYTGGVKNDYAAFLHTVGLGRRAYAFPYDDINDQSSVQILGNANPPTALTLGIGW